MKKKIVGVAVAAFNFTLRYPLGYLAVLVPGKNSISVLRKHYSKRSGNGSQPFYQTTITSEELLEAITNAFLPKKQKR